jgi:hypothetical protein
MVNAREGAETPRGSARGRDAPGRVVAREERPLGRPPPACGETDVAGDAVLVVAAGRAAGEEVRDAIG